MKKSLLALASGTLGLGIAEFVMMGILPNVARDLNISIPEAGHFISAYAIGVCVGAPLTVFVARTRPLKQILLGLAAIYVIGNLCAALAPEYWTLLLMRFVSGLPHGAFFGVGSIVAERVADKGKTSQAVALMIAGMTIANLFGVPFGTLLSNLFSWRFPFLFNGMLGNAGILPRLEMDTCFARLAGCGLERTVPLFAQVSSVADYPDHDVWQRGSILLVQLRHSADAA